jgi:REP-associated tyrosine transposase
MGRSQRVDVDGVWHHVMNRGAARLPTFVTKSDALTFERLVGEGHARFGVEVHAYCLMSNHFHLLVHCPTGGLSPFMQHVAAVYTRAFNERHGRDGPLFRGRFHSLLVHDDRYVVTAARYIHRNPLDLGPAVDLAAYRWSSHGVYLGRRPCPEWLRTGTVLSMFAGGVPAYRDVVESDRADDRAVSSPDQVLEFLDLVAAEQSPSATSSSPRLSRTVAAAILDRVDAPTRTALEERLAFPDRKARTSAIRRARQRVEQSGELGRLVDQVIRRAA